MKKVGLCIVYKNWNYGSVLQSYATLLELKKLDIDYEIIRYERKKDLSFYVSSLPRLLLPDMRYSKMRALKRKVGMKLYKDFAKKDAVRAKVFSDFIKRNFDKFSEVIKDFDTLRKYARKFSSVIVGSDQLMKTGGI